MNQELNALPLSALAFGATALTQNIPNPFAGLLPGTSLNASTIARQQLLVPYSEFLLGTTPGNGITENFRPIGRSAYNSAQFLLMKRLSHGLNFSVAYTISKQIDQASFANPQDVGLERVIAAWDIPQNLQVNFVYELPFGAGKPYGADLPNPVRWAISGWQFSTLDRLQKGMPLNFPPAPLRTVSTGNSRLGRFANSTPSKNGPPA